MNKNVLALIFCFLIFFQGLKANALTLNCEQSKITYSLSCLGIVFKKKDLPVKGDVEIETVDSSFVLKNLNLITSFTSKNPLFRKVIDYDRYPYVQFDSLIEAPIVLNENRIIELEGILTFHGVAKKMKIPLTCLKQNDSVLLTGPLIIPMTEFGIIPPRILFIKVDDFIKLNIELLIK